MWVECGMSVSVTMRITAANGKMTELKERLISNLAGTREFTGAEQITLLEPREHVDVLLLIEQWDKIESFQAYKKWRNESGTSVLAGDLVAKAPDVTISDILF